LQSDNNLIKTILKTKKMKKLLISQMFVLCLCSNAMAETTQTVTVNGSPIDKQVTQLTFSGDNVTLLFNDNSSQTEDMSLVNIMFSYTATGINNILATEKIQDGKVYSISGQYVGNTTNGLQKGIYIVNGKKIVVK